MLWRIGMLLIDSLIVFISYKLSIKIILSFLQNIGIYSCGLRNGERKQTALTIRSEIHESFEFFLNEP